MRRRRVRTFCHIDCVHLFITISVTGLLCPGLYSLEPNQAHSPPFAMLRDLCVSYPTSLKFPFKADYLYETCVSLLNFLSLFFSFSASCLITVVLRRRSSLILSQVVPRSSAACHRGGSPAGAASRGVLGSLQRSPQHRGGELRGGRR